MCFFLLPAFYSLIIRLVIKPSRNLLRIHHIDERVLIHFPDFLHDGPDFIPSYDGIKHVAFPVAKTSDSLKKRGVMVGIVPNLLINLVHLFRYNEKRLLLVPLIQGMETLRRGKLENNGVQRFVPAKKAACNQKNNTVPYKNIVPGFDAVPFRKENGNKIRAAAGSARIKTEADGKSVNDAAEHTDQKRILRNHITRNNIRQNTR